MNVAEKTIAPAEAIASTINIEAESSVIAAMLQVNQNIEFAADMLRPEMFYLPTHALMFETIIRLSAKGTVTPVTLRPYLEDDAGFHEMGGNNYLAGLGANAIGILAFSGLVRQVRELYQRRMLIAGLHEGISLCSDPSADLEKTIATVDAALAVDHADDVSESTSKQCFDELFASFQEEVFGVTCDRIPSIDKLIGPARPKQLIIIAARPGIGKTAVALSYAIGAAQRDHGVMFISLEMSSVELTARMGADLCFTGESGIPFARIRDNRLSADERQQLHFAGQRFANHPFHLVDAGSLTVGRVRRLVRRHKRRMEAQGHKLELVVIDYLQLLSPDQRARSAYEAISEISRTLKQIAKDENVAIIALAQLSREVEKRPDKRPQLSDLRDSGQIEQDADTVLFLTRQEYYHRMNEPHPDSLEWPQWKSTLEGMQGEIEFICAKRRNGRTGSTKGLFAGAYQAVRG